MGIEAIKLLFDSPWGYDFSPITKEDELIKQIHTQVRRLMDAHQNTFSHYITSFTSEIDDLRQWMCYGKSNASYCIVFKKEFLNNIGSVPNFRMRWLEVEYEYSNEKALTLKQFIKEILDKHSKNPDRNPITEATKELLFYSIAARCNFKPKEFKDEKETRIILQSAQSNVIKAENKDVRFCERSGIIIPYVDIPIDLEWIEKIIIGPNIQRDLAEMGIKCLLRAKNISCEVSHTSCSLRQF